MKFVKLTNSVLIFLKSKGYTTLHSTAHLSNENPTWIPYKDDVEKILDLDSEYIAKISSPMDEVYFLIIEDAIKNIEDKNLIGQVFISDLEF